MAPIPARSPSHRRRLRRRLTTSVVTLLCAGPIAACVAASPATAAPPLPSPALSPSPSPIGVHSMLYLDHPFSAKEAMFRAAAALGASTIRLDIALSGVFPTPGGPPDWSGVDQYMLLARRYRLRVLADLLATPAYMAHCATTAEEAISYRCAPADPGVWGHDAGLIAGHTRGVIDEFEIINEPDGSWFYGTPQQYARILSASYRAIHAADPNAVVVLGGLMDIAGHGWLEQVLATPGARALHSFDIANIHVRTAAAQAAPTVLAWRRYLARRGFRGPLWVTETGYPADPAWQTEPGYRDGPDSQARWLTTVIPAMLRAGAAMVFVTERDSLSGRYASEGVLQTPDPLPADPSYTPRPSYYAVRALIQELAGRAGYRRIVASPLRMMRLPF
ncbi:MAG TPA: hypothetical protein VIY10_01345 [Solirubrobacteraceae bacterium]